MKTLPYPLMLATVLFALVLAGCSNDSKPENPAAKAASAGMQDIQEIDQRIAQDPQNAKLYAARAGLYQEKGAYDEAIADLERALEIDTANIDYLHILADWYFDYYRSRRGLQTMQKAAQLYPTRIPTLLKLAEFEFILKQYDEALKTLERIRRVDPQNSEMLYMAGLIMLEQEKPEAAINNFQAAVEQDPDLIEAWLELGKIFAERNNKIAMLYFDNALRVDSTNVTALHDKAYYLSNNLNDLEGALQLYRKIVIHHPLYADGYFNAGLLYLDMNNFEEAYKQFDMAAKASPTFIRAYYYRGVASQFLGNLNAAKADYEQTLRMAPDFEAAQEALRDLQKLAKEQQ